MLTKKNEQIRFLCAELKVTQTFLIHFFLSKPKSSIANYDKKYLIGKKLIIHAI